VSKEEVAAADGRLRRDTQGRHMSKCRTMKPSVVLLLLGAAALQVPLASAQSEPRTCFARDPRLPHWEASTTQPGVYLMRLVGGRELPGFFVERRAFPNGMRGTPHWHSGSLHVTVLCGTYALGFGRRFQSRRLRRYGPGAFIVIPADSIHCDEFSGHALLEVAGIGPIATTEADPAP
jgi:hypothetical protein